MPEFGQYQASEKVGGTSSRAGFDSGSTGLFMNSAANPYLDMNSNDPGEYLTLDGATALTMDRGMNSVSPRNGSAISASEKLSPMQLKMEQMLHTLFGD